MGRRTKVVALIMLIAAATVLGAIIFTALASSEDISTSTAPSSICFPPRKEGIGWLSNLTDEQRTELKSMNEEFRQAVQAKLGEWGVQIKPGLRANLTVEQRTELQTMEQQFRKAVKAKLEEWGVKLPEPKDPKGWMSNLTEEQREELKALMEEFQSTLQAKLKEWGVEAPAPPNPMSFRSFGSMHLGRGCQGFPSFQIP